MFDYIQRSQLKHKYIKLKGLVARMNVLMQAIMKFKIWDTIVPHSLNAYNL